MRENGGVRQSDDVRAGATAAKAAGGFDGDVGRREREKSVEGLKRTLSPAGSVCANPNLNLSLVVVV